jgi:hypothetical protein
MRQERIRNLLLALIVMLLFLNLADRMVGPAQAFATKQYRSIEVMQAAEVQQVLNKAVAEGWEYVGSIDHVLIFRRIVF